jgi:hypothetical protein
VQQQSLQVSEAGQQVRKGVGAVYRATAMWLTAAQMAAQLQGRRQVPAYQLSAIVSVGGPVSAVEVSKSTMHHLQLQQLLLLHLPWAAASACSRSLWRCQRCQV